MSKAVDYVLRDATNVAWPGLLPYRGTRTTRGRGYKTREEAERRALAITSHYSAEVSGSGGPDLRVVERKPT